ncbi:hypothetical protein V5O48_003091 [Marasmius crinis-equi]|uniref:F-box domain-containing protein n=1 Tax=Marasmius crinis-equi TaxID=585013 RepID=A0ABR3FUA3_9AGAR
MHGLQKLQPLSTSNLLMMHQSASTVELANGKLPEEILSYIFILSYIRSALDFSGAVWTYIKVCSAALNTSPLWTKIHVDSRFLNRTRRDHVKSIIRFVLAQSRCQPLVVALNMADVSPSDVFNSFFHALLASSRQWSSLRYSHSHSYTPFEHFKTTTHAFSPSERFPALTKIAFTSVPSMDCRYVLRNAPNMERLELVDCGLLFSPVFRNLPLHRLRFLSIAGCAVDREGWWPNILRRVADLEELVVDRDCWVRLGGEDPSIDTIILSNLRTLVLNDGTRNILPNLIPARLENIEVVASAGALSQISQIVRRSFCRPKRVSIFGIELLDVTVEGFLRTIGSDVEELTLDGLVLNHLFHVLAKPSPDFLPKLVKLTVRQSPKGRKNVDLRCSLQLAQQISLPLESLIAAVRARMHPGSFANSLKAVDICLSRSAFDVQLAGSLSSLEGLTSTIRYLDAGPVDYGQLGNLLQHCASFYRDSHEILYQENIPSIVGLFTYVENCITCNSVTRAQMRGVRAAMVSFAYRRSRFSAREREFDIKGRAKAICKRLDMNDA